MNIAIIKYNAGNVASVMYALDRIGAKYTWTDDEKVIQAADKVIFPGVGEASTAMAYLKEKKLDQLNNQTNVLSKAGNRFVGSTKTNSNFNSNSQSNGQVGGNVIQPNSGMKSGIIQKPDFLTVSF